MHYRLVFCLALSVLMLFGCAGMSKQDKDPEGSGLLEPQATLKFADIPVPKGFQLVSQDSYAFENSGIRVGVLKYRGTADPEMVENFYKQQMIIYNWNLVNIIEYGQRLMNFERESETCNINLQPKGNSITITISVGPKSQLAPKKSKEKSPVK